MIRRRFGSHAAKGIEYHVHETISHSKGTQMIKQLYKTQAKTSSKFRNESIVKNGLHIYQSMERNHRQTHFVINTFIKLLIHFECHSQYVVVWQDIQSLFNTDDHHLISYPSLLKCCVASRSNINHDECMQILRWMQQTKYELKAFETRDFSRSVSTFISQCHKYDQLQSIASCMRTHNDIFIKTALINAYGRLDDCCDSALNVFNSIDDNVRNSVCFNAMMTVLLKQGYNDKTLRIYDTFEHLQNDISHNLAIKACCNTRNLDKGKQIHLRCSNKNIQINNTLMDLYGSCDDIESAMSIFESIHKDEIDSVSINNIMKGLVHVGNYNHAIHIYEQFTHLCNDISHVLALKACAKNNDLDKGKQIHYKRKSHKGLGLYLNTALIHFYGAFGEFETAQTVFDSIANDEKDSALINALMNILMDNDQHQRALDLYKHNARLCDAISHALAIKCCSRMKDFDMGRTIHANISDYSLSLNLKHTLIDLYGNCGEIETALQIFSSINEEERNFSTINVMKTAYYNNNCHKEALQLYDEFSALQDDISHVLALKACVQCGEYDKGLMICDKLQSNHDLYIRSTLMDFYGHFGDIDAAKQVFDSIGDKDSMCVNAMMKVYSKHGADDCALLVYKEYGSLHDDVSHLLAIKCCINLRDYAYGTQIHKQCVNMSLQLTNTLIDFYGKFEDISTAIDIYNSIDNDTKSVVTINAMMNGYYNCNLYQECVVLFEQMCEPDVVSFAILFKTCIHDGMFEFGRTIHDALKQNTNGNRWMLRDESIQVALINMYGKYGMMGECEEILEDIRKKEGVQMHVWHAMSNVYSRNGDADKTKALLNDMVAVGLSADKYIFIALLNAFSHSGDVDGAANIWRNEINDIGIQYDPYVITSLIDCFARGGLLQDAQQLILQYEEHSKCTNEVMWTSLLSGCRKHKNAQLTQTVYEQMNQRFDLTDPNSSITTLLRGIKDA